MITAAISITAPKLRCSTVRSGCRCSGPLFPTLHSTPLHPLNRLNPNPTHPPPQPPLLNHRTGIPSRFSAAQLERNKTGNSRGGASNVSVNCELWVNIAGLPRSDLSAIILFRRNLRDGPVYSAVRGSNRRLRTRSVVVVFCFARPQHIRCQYLSLSTPGTSGKTTPPYTLSTEGC